MTQTGIKEEHEDPPGPRPPHSWEDFPWERWNDWRWQLSHRLDTAEDFARVIRLTPEKVASLLASGRFRVDVTPDPATLADPDEPPCPFWQQVIPTVSELLPFEAEITDSLAEDVYSFVPDSVYRYPDRVLLLFTAPSASYDCCCSHSCLAEIPLRRVRTCARIAAGYEHQQVRMMEVVQ